MEEAYGTSIDFSDPVRLHFSRIFKEPGGVVNKCETGWGKSYTNARRWLRARVPSGLEIGEKACKI